MVLRDLEKYGVKLCRECGKGFYSLDRKILFKVKSKDIEKMEFGTCYFCKTAMENR